MIDFNENYIYHTIKIKGKDTTVKVKKLSYLDRVDFNTKIFDSESATIGGIQENNLRVNLSEILKAPIFLFIRTVKEIEGFDEWKTMKEKEKENFIRQWIEYDSDEFAKNIESLENIVGKLLG